MPRRRYRVGVPLANQRLILNRLTAMSLAVVLLTAGTANATGLATCDSGDPANWKPQEALQAELEAKGWQVRRIKIDGGCYEVYAVDANGKRVEAYFDPRDFALVATEED